MYRKKYKKLIAIIALIIALNIALTGCRGDKVGNQDNEVDTNYNENNEEVKEIYESTDNSNRALYLLKEKYGEEFEVVQKGGTFGTGSDSRKFFCSPVKDKNILVQVQLMSDMSTIQDDYINRIMEEKLAQYLEPKAKEIFGKDLRIKILLSGIKNEYTSLDMDPIEFFNNSSHGYGMDIFIKSDSEIDKDVESKKLEVYMNYIIQEGIITRNYIKTWYTNEDEFKSIDTNYYNKEFSGDLSSYYKEDSRTFNDTGCRIVDSKIEGGLDEIRNSFRK